MKQVYFVDKMEIRMGSPFNHCKLKFEGFTLPELSEGGFQDIYSWDHNHKFLALIKWDIKADNEPGFDIVVSDTEKEEVIFSSDRIEGICTSLSLDNDRLEYSSISQGSETVRSIQIKQ
ncbi:hypothetical protein FKX85_15830 [Echinicola soli]|uniref:Uncharacterized protein n=1 Tax=Echinicola soli TaxID=2591634 RepID=A0A514CKR6_9BACT|nr:hypothetical protein [Echinicola soli]QDH80431.1 hypothetical protein FKX85_15830 [Echinicola soli]